MKESIYHPAWLILPALLLYSTDITVTLSHQPAEYWHGEYQLVEEGNPVARWIMLHGPIVAISVASSWAICFSIILYAWRHPWAVVMSFVLTFFHACGAASWFLKYGWLGVMAAVMLLVLTERLWTWAWRRSVPQY